MKQPSEAQEEGLKEVRVFIYVESKLKIEDTEWNPPRGQKGKCRSNSVAMLRSLQIGDVKRIIHDDLACTIGKDTGDKHAFCSLAQSIHKLCKQGWDLDYYHERPQVLVVRRKG